MSKKVVVAMIHGMGSQDEDFADPMIDVLSKIIASKGKSPDDVLFLPIHWSDCVEFSQRQYLEKIKKENKIDWVKLREFVVYFLGDATAYQHNSDTYRKVHERVYSLLKGAYESVDEDTPLVMLCHSLGAVVMSNYIWDTQKFKVPGFMGFESMKFFLTYGTTLPLFSFSHDPAMPIRKPEGCRWYNYYDRDDVLGYPLKGINDFYDQVVDDDIEISVGGWLTGWNPACHAYYGESDKFQRKVARFIASLL